MFCKNCGGVMNETQGFCPNCGAKAESHSPFCPNCRNAVSEEDSFCVQCGVSLKNGNFGTSHANTRGIQERSIVLSVVLSLITCGIYTIYWFVCLTNEINQASGKTQDASGGVALLLSLVTCGIYSYIWAYKLGEKRDIIANEKASSNILYLLLVFFGLGIVAYALAQDAINHAIQNKGF